MPSGDRIELLDEAIPEVALLVLGKRPFGLAVREAPGRPLQGVDEERSSVVAHAQMLAAPEDERGNRAKAAGLSWRTPRTGRGR